MVAGQGVDGSPERSSVQGLDEGTALRLAQQNIENHEEQSGLRDRIAALAPAVLPKGVGAYSAAVLHYEMRGVERFKNRRQVGSMTGLCPGIHLSDGRGKEGLDQPLWDRDCALDPGGDVWAPDDLAAAVSTGSSLSGWPGQKQTRQEALGRSSSAAFSHRFMAFIHRANHP